MSQYAIENTGFELLFRSINSRENVSIKLQAPETRPTWVVTNDEMNIVSVTITSDTGKVLTQNYFPVRPNDVKEFIFRIENALHDHYSQLVDVSLQPSGVMLTTDLSKELHTVETDLSDLKSGEYLEVTRTGKYVHVSRFEQAQTLIAVSFPTETAAEQFIRKFTKLMHESYPGVLFAQEHVELDDKIHIGKREISFPDVEIDREEIRIRRVEFSYTRYFIEFSPFHRSDNYDLKGARFLVLDRAVRKLFEKAK